MSLSVVVFGAGRFGSAIAMELFQHNVEVMVVDKEYDLVQNIANHVTTAIQCDLSDESAVEELGLSNFDVAVIAIGTNLESSIIALMQAKKYNIPRIIAKANSDMQKTVLEQLGANQIIFPERDMGVRLARSLSGNNIMEYIHFSDKYSLVEVKASPSWFGRTLIDLDFRNTYHLNAVAIRRKPEVIISNLGQEVIRDGDMIILIGETKDIEKFQ